LTKTKIWVLVSGAFLAVLFLTLAGLIFTPLALVVPLPNSVLEEKYGRQLLETQTELKALAQEVLRLGEYNRQLRKVLGDEVPENQPDKVAATPDSEEVDERMPMELTLAPYVPEDEFAGDAGPLQTTVVSEAMYRVTLPLMTPVSGIISQHFDPDRLHFGVDYASKIGTPVFAAADGYIVFSGWTPEDGNMIMVSHGTGLLTVYKHNQSLLRPAHETVKRGELVALLGSSGRTSTGPHLHFEVWSDGVPVDPEQYLLLSQRETQRQ
jgi:murein DD-endopeptidase MepM/ murein hydrolase activator NlpD